MAKDSIGELVDEWPCTIVSIVGKVARVSKGDGRCYREGREIPVMRTIVVRESRGQFLGKLSPNNSPGIG